MPGTMFTPGYEEENKTKPELVLKIEESDGGLSSEKAAEGLYQGAVTNIPMFKDLIGVVHAGVRKGNFHITDTFISDIFRSNTRGASPFGSNILKDLLYGLIGVVCPHACLPRDDELNICDVDCLGGVEERCGQTSSWS